MSQVLVLKGVSTTARGRTPKVSRGPRLSEHPSAKLQDYSTARSARVTYHGAWVLPVGVAYAFHCAMGYVAGCLVEQRGPPVDEERREGEGSRAVGESAREVIFSDGVGRHPI